MVEQLSNSSAHVALFYHGKDESQRGAAISHLSADDDR